MATKTKPRPTISVIIPTQNRSRDLAECLRSIENQSYPKRKIEIIVIDNDSQDNTQSLLKKKFPRVKLITLSENIGFAPAVNRGGKKAKGKYILVTNDDVIFDSEYVKEMVNFLESKPKIGVAHGKMYYKNSNKVATPGFKIIPFLGYHPRSYDNLNATQECDVATGGNMFIRKSLFDRLNGFDEDFFFCGEDYDLCFRARRLGAKIYYRPQAICWHGFLESGKPPQANQNALFAHYRGKFRYMLKNATVPQMLVFFPTQILIIPVYSYLKSRQKKFLPIIKALAWNTVYLKDTLKSRQEANRL